MSLVRARRTEAGNKKWLSTERRVDVDMELLESNTNGDAADRNTLLLLSGVALVIFGAGLIVSNPMIRRYMSQLGLGNLAQGVMPDIERYFRLRSM
jgi:hypothetical protein